MSALGYTHSVSAKLVGFHTPVETYVNRLLRTRSSFEDDEFRNNSCVRSK
jgi:hypothetical protein